MSYNSPIENKIAKYSSLLLFVYICSVFTLKAQHVIYKKDGIHIKVAEIDTLKSILSYKILNTNDTVLHFLSRNAVDSIQFENGKIKHFFVPLITNEVENFKLKKNFIGLNIWPYFQGTINGFYERLIYENQLGFKNQFQYRKYTTYDHHDAFVNYTLVTGINYYFLHSAFFRLGTGLSYYREKHDKYDYENMDYENVNYQNYVPDIVRESYNVVYINGSFSAIAKEKLYLSIVFDIPLNVSTNYRTLYFKTEIAINF
jgi:hypothetical protein